MEIVRHWVLSDQGQGHRVTLKCFSFYHNTNCQVLYLSFGACEEVVNKYVCQSDNNNIQDLLISSRLKDLTKTVRGFNVDTIMLYISAMYHARKLKFSK